MKNEIIANTYRGLYNVSKVIMSHKGGTLQSVEFNRLALELIKIQRVLLDNLSGYDGLWEKISYEEYQELKNDIMSLKSELYSLEVAE